MARTANGLAWRRSHAGGVRRVVRPAPTGAKSVLRGGVLRGGARAAPQPKSRGQQAQGMVAVRGGCARGRREATTRASASAEVDRPAAPSAPQQAVTQILAGLTTTLSMIPESLAFTFVAGVSPIVGLHAAATMALFACLFGSQHGVISGAAGATAVVLAPLCAARGVEYLFAAVLLSGIVQCVAGALRLGKFIRLVPQPVMMGFVNGLAIVIGSSQLEQFRVGHAWLTGTPLYTMAALTAVTMVIIKVWPSKRLRIPSPLAAIACVTAGVHALGITTRTVGDMASVAGSLPSLHIPQVPFTYETLTIILPFAVSVAAVGLIETLLTQQLVDSVTETRTETHVECIGQGVANVACGVLGGMGGCAMIGQSMINVNAGGRTRLSGLSCAAFLALSVCAGSSIIDKIPLAALVGTMWMLVLDIFDFGPFLLRRASRVGKTDTFVVALVTGVTVVTNLAVAVFAGVVVSSLSFAWKSAQVSRARTSDEPGAHVRNDGRMDGWMGEGMGPLSTNGPPIDASPRTEVSVYHPFHVHTQSDSLFLIHPIPHFTLSFHFPFLSFPFLSYSLRCSALRRSAAWNRLPTPTNRPLW